MTHLTFELRALRNTNFQTPFKHQQISSAPSLPGYKPLLLIIVLDLNAQGCEIHPARLKRSWSLGLIHQEPDCLKGPLGASLAVKIR